MSDVTHVSTQEGWLYLAIVLDVYSREVVGWAMSERTTEELPPSALKTALQQHRPGSGPIHHSDQGEQYTGYPYQVLLKEHGIQASINSVGRGSGLTKSSTAPGMRLGQTSTPRGSTIDVGCTRFSATSARRSLSKPIGSTNPA
jgi:hypothetical protein